MNLILIYQNLKKNFFTCVTKQLSKMSYNLYKY